MGIFVEDLLHFGNLMDREIPIDISPEDLKPLFGEDKRISVIESGIRVSKEERGFLFKKNKEKIMNIKGPSDGLSIRVEIIRDDFDKRAGVKEDIKLEAIIRSKETFKKIPEKIRDRLFISRVIPLNGTLRVYLKLG